MSRLFYSESGLVVRFLNEELTTLRRARKIIRLPDTVASAGTLYVYAHPHMGHALPLRLSVNGHESELGAGDPRFFRWYEMPVPAEQLVGGENVIEVWCDGHAMDSWVLGIEGNPEATDSRLSFDGGVSWQNDCMSVAHRLRGEYVVRLRLDDDALTDPAHAPFVWEARESAHLDAMRELIPERVREIEDPWNRVRALATWVSQQWIYRNTNGGKEYAPWHAPTILSWGRAAHGQEVDDPIVMCVHYAVVFVQAALALGIPARNICSTNRLGGMLGHFVSEVWMERWQKWCYVDANCDVVHLREGVPLSVDELHPAGKDLPALAEKGPGFETQSEFVRDASVNHFITGQSFAVWAVWPRNDYFSHPEATPPMHGSGWYCETDWLWAPTPLAAEMGMFPHRVGMDVLQQPPPAEWR